MTKSLSNIIKWNCIHFENQDTYSINSDSAKTDSDFLGDSKKIIAGIHIASPQEIADNFLKKEDSDLSAGEFASGMNVINYDKMMKEERERIAQEADSLISNAEKTAKKMIEEANSQVEQIKQSAFEEGKQEGFAEGLAEAEEEVLKKKGDLQKKEANLIEKENELEEEYQRQKESLEPFFAKLTISLLEKITGVLLTEKSDIILHLIHSGIREIGKSKQFLIRVSSKDFPIVKEAKDMILSKLPSETIIEIKEDDSLSSNQCFIETDTKVIDSSLDTQLYNLAEDLKLLAITK